MLHRLRDYFRKPEGRAARHPHYLEIVVARTGHPARTFRLNLDMFKKTGQALGLLLLAWFGGTFYVAYAHLSNMDAIARAGQQEERIAMLESSNQRLAEEKQSMGQYMSNLRARVEQLAERVHGMVNRAQTEFPAETDGPQGGVAIPVSSAEAAEMMRREFSLFDDNVDDLLPLLETSLAREIARPVGSPVAGGIDISSHYGVRGNPFGRGTPVLATGPGRVEAAGHDGPNGNRVAIDHGFGYRSVYAHLSRVDVKAGDAVERGQALGLSGNTGRSSGPHLHYTLYYRGQTINPARYVKTN